MDSVRLAMATLGVSLFATVWTSGCSSPMPASAPPPKATELLGDMKPVVSVKELMEDMLDPLADNIFNSVSIVTNKKGTVETSPKTDEAIRLITGALVSSLANGTIR